MIYCLDTSAFVQPWHERYPVDVFPSFWKAIEDWIEEDKIIAPEEVMIEVQKVDDDLLKWIKSHKEMFRPPDAEVQKEVQEILKRHTRLVDTKRGRSIADPWVIAQAVVCDAIIVTEELPSRGRSPKIPDVCEDLEIPYTNVLGLIREMGLKF
ncbi:MAG: DUF4411 family protein [Phycisphaerales bacterium]|nr:MAG: DUF4411 family protein [Phycisphaerales bacterium]